MADSRYFVIDPGFEDFDSHHGVVAEALLQYSHSRGRPVKVLASQKLATSLKDVEGKIIPFFATPCYTNNLEPLPAAKENQLAEDFQRELSRFFLKFNINEDDVVVLHTGFSHLFLWLAKVLNNIGKQHAPRLIVCGMFDPGSMLIDSIDEISRFSWFIKNRLSLTYLENTLPSEKIMFATSCNEYKFGYQALLNSPVFIHPAINYQPTKRVGVGHKDKKALLLFVGSVKKDKGIDFIFRNLECLFKEFPNVDFVLHWNTNSPGVRGYKDAESKLNSLSHQFNNFEALFGTLSTKRYELLFDSVQGVVASYVPSSYRHKTSGIFWDVLRRTDCNLLCSNGTWLERESSSLGERAYFFDYGDIDSMIRAISEWEYSENVVEVNPTAYKEIICKSFSEWVLSQF